MQKVEVHIYSDMNLNLYMFMCWHISSIRQALTLWLGMLISGTSAAVSAVATIL